MVAFLQCVIPDDPEQRRAALVAVARQYCSHILFPSHVAAEGAQDEPSHRNFLENGNACDALQGTSMENLDLHVERISGGITNELFHVYHPCRRSQSVILRVFGRETERVVSRESELFYQSIFIPTYVRGTNFLIYEFLDMYEAMPFTELSLHYQEIAHALAVFQVRATLESRCDHHKPVFTDDERVYWDVGEPNIRGKATVAFDVCRFDREDNYTVHALTKLVDQMMSRTVLDKVCAEKRARYDIIARKLQEEAQWMRGVLERCTSELGESVCHNDLLGANIMRHKTTGSLKIIDFDYARRNYFLFDIANHFNEYAGLECDYERYFPSDSDMEKFILVYRQAMREELEKNRDEARRRQLDDIIPDQERLFLSVPGDEGEERRKTTHMVQFVKLLTLASHITWSIWAMLQEAVSALEMDFLEYAKLRFERYLATRDMFSAGFA